MIPGCPVSDNPEALAAPTVEAVDCFITRGVSSSYGALLGPSSQFSSALTIVLTLYIAIIGYRLIFGRGTLSMGEFAPRALLIGGVLALTTSWAAYQTLIFNLLTDAPQELAAMVSPAERTNAPLLVRVDTVAGGLIDVADAWGTTDNQGQPIASDTALTNMTMPIAEPSNSERIMVIRPSLGPNLLLASAVGLLLASAGVLVVAKILLGLLLALGPPFIVLALFGFTRGLAWGWLRAAVLLALVPVLAMLATGGALLLLEPMAEELIANAALGEFSLRAAVGLLATILVMLAVAVQMFRIATTITAGWSGAVSERLRHTEQAASTTTAATLLNGDPTAAAGDMRMQALVAAVERNAAVEPSMLAAPRAPALLATSLIQEPTRPASEAALGQRLLPQRAAPLGARATLKPVRGAA
jgi:type IV secretion system protein VirB6